MRILLLHDYRGNRTGGELIKRGEYASDDPRVFGLAQYLVDNGHARVITPAKVQAAPVLVSTADEPTEAQEQALADDSEAFEEIPHTRAMKRKADK